MLPPLNQLILIALTILSIVIGPSSLIATDRDDSGGFKSITEDLNFKAIYRIQTIVNGQPEPLVDVSESYHSSLATGVIKRTVHRADRHNPAQIDLDVRKILYHSESGRLIEYYREKQQQDADDDGANLSDPIFQDDFYLHENGGSNSYGHTHHGAKSRDEQTSASSSAAAWRQHSVRLVPYYTTLDSFLLLASDTVENSSIVSRLLIDLNNFMTAHCLDLIRSKLHYINGATRLLLLIECRRDEFRLQSGDNGDRTLPNHQQQLTRGRARLMYAANSLEPVASDSASTIKKLDVTVTIPVERNSKRAPMSTLPESSVPLSIVVSYTSRDGSEVTSLINVFQFESVDASEHLSESASSTGAGGSAHSSYMLPLADDKLADLLDSIDQGPAAKTSGDENNPYGQFGFHATLTGSRLVGFTDPIELIVVYDQQSKLMASQMSFVDRTKSADPLDGWARETTRTLYDGMARLKYHIMRSNLNSRQSTTTKSYGQAMDNSSSGGDDDDDTWRSCATDKLTPEEVEMLTTGAGGGRELFPIDGERGASVRFMGTSLVRGMLCYVFERRLSRFPTFLGLGEHDYAHFFHGMSDHSIYLISYIAVEQVDSGHFGSAPGRAHRAALEAGAKLVRLDIRAVSRSNPAKVAWYQLEVRSFDWSTQLLDDMPDLFDDVSHECLISQTNLGHLDMELWLELRRDGNAGSSQAKPQLTPRQVSAIELLASDEGLRDEAVAQMLTNSLGISRVQQVDLESQVLGPVGQDVQVYVKFSLYALPDDVLANTVVGSSEILAPSLPSEVLAERGLQVGGRSYSYRDCEWRALHSITPRGGFIWTTPKRYFMFCPQISRCIVGDSSWPAAIKNNADLILDDVYKFSSPSSRVSPGADDNCLVASLNGWRERGHDLADKGDIRQINADRRPIIDWLLLQRKDQFDTVRKLPLRLKVKVSPANGSTAKAGAGDGVGKPISSVAAGQPTTNGKQEQSFRTNNDDERGQIIMGDNLAPLLAPDTISLTLGASGVKMSNKALINWRNDFNYVNSEQEFADSDEYSSDAYSVASMVDTSLLTNPLPGLGYQVPDRMINSISANGNNNNNNDDDGGGIGDSSANRANQNNDGTQLGTGGSRPAAPVIEPFIATNLAECDRMCLLLHQCASYSACHTTSPSPPSKSASGSGGRSKSVAGQLACLFTKLNWSNRVEFNQLLKLAADSGTTKRASLLVQVNSEISSGSHSSPSAQPSQPQAQAVQVQFRRSSLCSLHARPHSQLYRYTGWQYRSLSKYSIYASSEAECARLCHERAHLMRQLKALENDSTNTNASATSHERSEKSKASPLLIRRRDSACTSYYFAPKYSNCDLQPAQDHRSLLKLDHLPPLDDKSSDGRDQPSPNGAPTTRYATVNRWRAWLRATSTDLWTSHLEHGHAPAYKYELDFEQIFVAQRNRRLVLVSGSGQVGATKSAASKRTYQHTIEAVGDLSECAGRCIELLGCRSFDYRLNKCVLNGVSLADLKPSDTNNASGESPWPIFRADSSSGAQAGASSTADTWWHYEPSELALFLLTQPNELAYSGAHEAAKWYHAEDADSDQAAGIFVGTKSAGSSSPFKPLPYES